MAWTDSKGPLPSACCPAPVVASPVPSGGVGQAARGRARRACRTAKACMQQALWDSRAQLLVLVHAHLVGNVKVGRVELGLGLHRGIRAGSQVSTGCKLWGPSTDSTACRLEPSCSKRPCQHRLQALEQLQVESTRHSRQPFHPVDK